MGAAVGCCVAIQENPLIVALEVEIFSLLEEMLENNVQTCIKYIDAWLDKALDPNDQKKLNVLKTKCLNRCLTRPLSVLNTEYPRNPPASPPASPRYEEEKTIEVIPIPQ